MKSKILVKEDGPLAVFYSTLYIMIWNFILWASISSKWHKWGSFANHPPFEYDFSNGINLLEHLPLAMAVN